MDQSTSFPKCPGCQQSLAPGRAQGLCPRCLLARAAFAAEPETSAPPAAVPDLAAVAAAFPQLEVLELIGRGGMGVVYRARQRSLNRLVALKLLAPGRERDPAFAERFAREARALAALNHPNIVTVHDFGFAASPAAGGVGGYYFLLMEFVDGVNLRQAMQAGRFTSEQALAIVPPVCAALQFAHERGIVHRDIKPENLLLDKDGRIKIADFGIAKMLGAPVADPARTGPGESGRTDPPERRPALQPEPTHATAAGTPHYMAPEQRDASSRTDHRADIYSLGVVLYELLTGELPGARLEPPSHKVQIDVRLDEIVLRALAVQPERRYATAAEFRTQVDTLATQLGPAPRPAAAPPPLPHRLKTSGGLLHTPEQLASFTGQFCFWRHRGHLVLDEHALTFSREGAQTIIPLSAIREVSVGEYPRAMNPVGLEMLRVSWEEEGQVRQRVLAPMEGWFDLPGTWNGRVAEWAAALRNAVARVTGREPASTPRETLPEAVNQRGVMAIMSLCYVIPAIVTFLILTSASRSTSAGNEALRWVFVLTMAVAGTLPLLLFRRKPAVRFEGGTKLLGGVLILLAVGMGMISSESRHRRQSAEIAARQAMLLACKSEESRQQEAVNELSKRLSRARDEADRRRLERQRIQHVSEQRRAAMHAANLQGEAAESSRSGGGFRWLTPTLPLLLAGVWLMIRRGGQTSAPPTGQRWKLWLGGSLLTLGIPVAALGVWVALQIARDPSWNPAPAEAFFTVAVALGSVTLLGGGLALLASARRGGRGGAAALLTPLVAGVASAFLFAIEQPDSRISSWRNAWLEASLEFEPVRLEGNVIVANLHSSVSAGPAEMRVALLGPRLGEAVLRELPVQQLSLPVSLVRSGAALGNRPWYTPRQGSNTWQIAFVFPHAAAAAETYRGLARRDLGPSGTGETELFDTVASDGERYRALLEIRPLVTGAHAHWETVTGVSHNDPRFVRLDWQVAAAAPGRLLGTFGDSVSTVPLEAPYRSRPNTLWVELFREDDGTVRLRGRLLERELAQSVPGDFDELADALLGSACFSAKGVQGDTFELCRVAGSPLLVTVIAGSPAPTPRWEGSSGWAMPGLALLGTGFTLMLALLVFALGRRRGWVAAMAGLVLAVMMALGLSLVVWFSSRAHGVPVSPPAPVEGRTP